MSIAVHATCFDASALAKLYIDELGSKELRQYWRIQATRYTTPFCFYETLGVLKQRVPKVLTREQYFDAASRLHAWFRVSSSQINDIDFTQVDVFRDAKDLAQSYDLDLSDAFQLLTLQAGFFAPLVGGSATLLVTADGKLAKAARCLKLPVWDCAQEPMPAT
jgi:predicted nucleic acid-binding protein